MGMAASQARFLGLTARKTNVEYEGQQVNQQRTVLANESSGLFNQMLELQVPTPPSATDYYNTRYVFNSNGQDFGITKWDTAGGSASGVYTVDIEYKVPGTILNTANYTGYSDFSSTADGKYSIKLSTSTTPYEMTKITAKNPDGTDNELFKELNEKNGTWKDEESYYSYTVPGTDGSSAQTYYIPGSTFDGVTNWGAGGTLSSTNAHKFYFQDSQITKKATAEAVFDQATNSDGRFSTVTLSNFVPSDPNDTEAAEMLNKMAGTTYDLDLTQVNDEQGYDEAMKEYEYQKMMYERAIQDINTKTEIIQQQDRTLELRLKQLDTEQEALKTEMDAVKEVIQKNVESTFKTFA